MKSKKQPQDPGEAQRLAFARLQDAGQVLMCLHTAGEYADKVGDGATKKLIEAAIELGTWTLKHAAEAHLETLKEKA